MQIEEGKSYIQKNPLLGRKVIHVERLRESVWGWNLCDLIAVWLEDAPFVERKQGLASSVYDNQGLEEIPYEIFGKILTLAKLYGSIAGAQGETIVQPQANETLAKCLELLEGQGIITPDTYSMESIRRYAEEYDRNTHAQMERVASIIDVHK